MVFNSPANFSILLQVGEAAEQLTPPPPFTIIPSGVAGKSWRCRKKKRRGKITRRKEYRVSKYVSKGWTILIKIKIKEKKAIEKG